MASTRYWLPRVRTLKKSMPKARASSPVRPVMSNCSIIARLSRARLTQYWMHRQRPPAQSGEDMRNYFLPLVKLTPFKRTYNPIL